MLAYLVSMLPRLYRDLVPWYHLIDPLADHEDEALAFIAIFDRTITPRPQTLLELGSGAGNTAYYLGARYTCTLSDLSPDMLALSRRTNPACDHHEGDMRTLRLGRTFDAVLIHDAICYITTATDLLLTARTAFVHTRPGGAALFAPDTTKETFVESTEILEGDDGALAVRGLEWGRDPDPDDTTLVTDFALLLKDGDEVIAVHDRHVEGIFTEATWHEVLTTAGFQVERVERPIGDGRFDRIFLGRRPM